MLSDVGQSRVLSDNSPPTSILIYRIDAEDRLSFVNPAWQASAVAAGAEGLQAERVVGRTLWSYFEDETVKAIYRRLVERARGGRAVKFTYRCDKPDVYRSFLLRIEKTPTGEVEFVSVPLEERTRPSVALLEPDSPRDGRQLRMCSWCQRVELPVNFWVPIEEAAAMAGILEADRLPQLTHGVCGDCQRRVGQ